MHVSYGAFGRRAVLDSLFTKPEVFLRLLFLMRLSWSSRGSGLKDGLQGELDLTALESYS